MPSQAQQDAQRMQLSTEIVQQISRLSDVNAAQSLLDAFFRDHAEDGAIYRLVGASLAQIGRAILSLRAFQQALKLDPNDSQAHIGVAGSLFVQGELQQGLNHYRQALGCQVQEPKSALQPPSPPTYDHHLAEQTLWQVLAHLAAAGVHAFPTAGSLLGLVREGHLLPFDKDVDIGLPFEQMDTAAACLQAAGWQRKINLPGMTNPQEWHNADIALDLCGFSPDPSSGKVISGFWFHSSAHPWSRVTEYPDLKLQQITKPYGKVWQLVEPEAILVPLYGADWRTPDPDFDTVIAAQ